MSSNLHSNLWGANLGGNKLVLSNRFYMFACLTAIVVYLAPYIYLWTDARLLIHDNLDSNFVWYKVLLDSGTLFSDNTHRIGQMINGLPRSCLPSEFDVFVLLFSLLGPYGGYVANRVLMTLIGFLGTYWLLRRHVVPGEQNALIHFGVALCYALLPFWPFGGLSVAGIPLALCVFLNIRAKDYAWYNWVIIVLYPMYSNLVLSGFFLLFCLALLWFSDLIRKKATAGVFVALALASAAYIFTHYRLFLIFLFKPDFVSHRLEFAGNTSLKEALIGSLQIFLKGQYHAHSLHTCIVLPVILFAAFLIRKYANKAAQNMYFTGLGFILLTSLWYGLLKWEALAGVMSVLRDLVPIQLQRFHFLHPAVWMILFAISLSTFLQVSKKANLVVIVILLAQVFYISSYHELIRNRKGPSFASFYAEEQFKAISDDIGENKADYRVVSLGIHPSIAQYNGFYTLDGYLSNYPLSYKHQFRRIISGELEKNDALKRYYDDWGSRIYLFSSELRERGGYVMNMAGNSFEIKHLDIDREVFHEMGGRYILSAVRIQEQNNRGIVFKKVFKSSSSAWDIYLYEVE